MLRKLLEGRRGVFLGAVRGTEWGQFLDYVHPSFFDVIGLRDLLAQGQEMAANLVDVESFGSLRADQARSLAERRVRVQIDAASEPQGEAAHRDERELAQRILEVYFGQLYSGDATILDLRGGRWTWPAHSDAPTWLPRPLWIRWEPGFLAAVLDMYRGFYRDDDATFERGIRALHLGPAADVLRAHFGEGDQRAVRFETQVFHSSFHQVFVRCREEGVSLHPNFLALGIYLACLYDALDGRGPLDVRDAFERAAS